MQHQDAPAVTAVSQTASPERPTAQARRAVFSGAAGSALEWFDFAVYGALSATVFPTLFFHSLDPAMGLLASFVTFGVGFFARPLGGLVFGQLGDRIGRRQVLLATFISMGTASLIIGLLPTYEAIGFTAPLLLVLMRFVQGFALGGEATGAQLLTMEHAPRNRRALYGALMGMGSPLSQVLATLLLTVLSTALSAEAFTSWGWRIPFLMSILLVIVGIYIRLRIEETPLFEHEAEELAAESAAPLVIIRGYWRTIARLILAYAPIVLTFYIVSVFGIAYLTSHGFDRSQTYAIIMVSNLLSVVAIWWGGHIADRIGRRRVLFIGSVVALVAGLAFFPAADTGNFPLVLTVVAVALTATQFGNAAQGALFAEAFPTRVRYTGSALALTGSTLLFAAPAPFIASWLTSLGFGTTPVIVFWAAVIVAALVNTYTMREGRTLEGGVQSFGTGRLAQ
ncbi:MFS transporter [Sinomonas cyclohexanicum]|uniref:MFS transporter n=1 Tax=Sinomonas cyclohexanicum TaxID=322009 RepID=A0ABM7PT12_SINCY|nr:MFS transporter [Corynebacterium cyclohexanicum]BCT75236.1 MFS transporter [Corynebacterium cyclohexanicum]